MLKDIYRNLLIEINEDVNRDGLIKTPERAAKALEYLVSGYNRDIHEIVNGALFDVKCEDIVVVKNIKFYSLCEHHILPFFGMCSVGYIPNSNGKVIGLSKIPRIVDMFSRRLQVQERLTKEIANAIYEVTNAKAVIVTMEAKADKYGGYLISRINEVRKFLEKNKDAYWINQYDNLMLIESYECIADEIIDEIKDVDYLFMAISSAGSISGVSRRIKKISPNTKVVCVDVNGSIIFGSEAKKRYIPGAGSSIRPSNLNYACIDEVIFVDEIDAINMCHSFTEKNYLIGGSSGLVLAGIKKYFDNYNVTNNCSVVTIFPDRGAFLLSNK